MSVEANIKSRQSAQTCKEFIDEEAQTLANPDRFYEILADHCASQIGKIVTAPMNQGKSRPMSRIERELFEARVLTFGIHRDKTVRETPLSYLEYLATKKDTFIKELRRYISTPEVQRELESQRDCEGYNDEDD